MISNNRFDPNKLPLLYPGIYDLSSRKNNGNYEPTKTLAVKILFQTQEEFSKSFDGFVSEWDIEDMIGLLLGESARVIKKGQGFCADFRDITIYETSMNELKSFRIANAIHKKGVDNTYDHDFVDIMLTTKKNHCFEGRLNLYTFTEHFISPSKHWN